MYTEKLSWNLQVKVLNGRRVPTTGDFEMRKKSRAGLNFQRGLRFLCLLRLRLMKSQSFAFSESGIDFRSYSHFILFRCLSVYVSRSFKGLTFLSENIKHKLAHVMSPKRIQVIKGTAITFKHHFFVRAPISLCFLFQWFEQQPNQ